MLTDTESPARDQWGEGWPDDPRCEDCGRSIVTRFGGEQAAQFCDSCQADFDLLNRAGKLSFEWV